MTSIRIAARNASLSEIAYAMKNLPDQTAFRMQRPGILAAAKVVAVESKKRAPVKSGRLRASLRVENKTIPYNRYGTKIRFSQSMVVSGKGKTSRGRANFEPIIGTGRTGAQTDVYWSHFIERGTKHGRYSNRRFVQRYKKRPPPVGSWRIKPRLFIEKSVEATGRQQEAAFVEGCARGLINLSRRLKSGKASKADIRELFPIQGK